RTGRREHCRDVVVVAVPLPVVSERLALQRLLSDVEVDRAACGAGSLDRPFEGRQRDARVAVGAPGQELEARLLHLWRVVQAALGVLKRAIQKAADVPRPER